MTRPQSRPPAVGAIPAAGGRPTYLALRRYVLVCDECDLDTQVVGPVTAGRVVAAHKTSTGHRAVAHPATWRR